MAWFGNAINEVIKKIDETRVQYITMSANFSNLEKEFDRFVNHSESKIDKLQKENEGIRRRLTEIEGLINGTFKTSMKEAIQNIVREHVNQNGNTEQLSQDKIKKLLNPNIELDKGN